MMDLNINTIGIIEQELINTLAKVKGFQRVIDQEFRGQQELYNHLGTLGVNAKVLKSALVRLINTIEYHEHWTRKGIDEHGR